MDKIAHVLDLDRQRIQAMIQRDSTKLMALLADDVFFIHETSAKDNKQSLLEAVLSGAVMYRAVETSEIETRDMGDWVLLTGKAHITIAVSGRRSEVAVRFSSAYVEREAGWQMQFWQATKLPG